MSNLKISANFTPYFASQTQAVQNNVNSNVQNDISTNNKTNNTKKLIVVGGALAAATLGIVFRKKIANVLGLAKKEAGNAGKALEEGAEKIKKPGIIEGADILEEGAEKTTATVAANAEKNLKNKTERIFEREDGTINFIEKYNTEGKTIEKLFYQADGKTLEAFGKYNADGKNIETLFYRKDGKTLKALQKYDTNEKLAERLVYRDDGKTLSFIEKFNTDNRVIEKAIYKPDGTIDCIKKSLQDVQN